MELGILHNSPPSTKRGCRAGRLHRLWHGLPPAPWPCTRSQHHSVPSRNLHPLMVPPFLQPHPDLQSAVGNAPLSSKHPAQLPTTDCLLSIISPMGGQPSDAPALSPPSPLQQGGQSSNAPALSPPSPLPQGGQPIALALSPPSPPPQGGQPSDAPGLSPSSSTLLLCPSDSTLNICHLNSQSAVKTATQESPELLVQSGELLVAVATGLGNHSPAVAKLASSIFVHLGSTETGLETVYSGDVFNTLQTIMAKDDTVRYRVYQLVVDLSTISPESLEASRRSGLLQKLVNEMHKDDDVLLQLNCLEVLSDLACSNHGLTFLDSQGIVKRLEEMMVAVSVESSPFGALLLPGLMKFFGGLARFHPKEVLGHFQAFVGLLFAAVSRQGDPSVKGLAIQTVGFIGATPEGKGALDKQGEGMKQCVVSLGSVVKNSPSDIRMKALHAVARLLRLQVSDQTQELLQVTESWFNQLCPSPFDTIWGIAKQPFTDLRLAALQVLESLALLPWGQRLMNDAAGFKEYLLDRAIETTKESKERKFHVVKVLSESPTMRDIFGEPYYVHLMEFYRQGPFFVRAQAEVAFEES
ncbi:hypothetical protein ACOMHN_044726 [Nucella lapillus]